jgi:hypothetical protein
LTQKAGSQTCFHFGHSILFFNLQFRFHSLPHLLASSTQPISSSQTTFSSTPQAITQNSFDLLVAGSSAHFLTAQLFALLIISLFLLLPSTRFHFRTFSNFDWQLVNHQTDYEV